MGGHLGAKALGRLGLRVLEFFIDNQINMMNPLKKDQLREEDRYMWGCGLRPHPHIYHFFPLVAAFFSGHIL
jgi:hypothetical protein